MIDRIIHMMAIEKNSLEIFRLFFIFSPKAKKKIPADNLERL